jgi:L-fuconolactonase
VVGWVDLQSPELAERLEYFSQYPKLRGFRHIVQSEPDDSFLLRDSFLKGISKLAKYHYTYDILIYPRQLQATLLFVKQFPDQKFVVDHIAKPNIKDGQFQPWAELIEQLAQYPNVWCKVSGIVTEADWINWSYHNLKPYLDHALSCFDPERIMFGSDWPVCLLAGSYEQIKALFETSISHFTDTQQNQMWGQNAADFYGLN